MGELSQPTALVDPEVTGAAAIAQALSERGWQVAIARIVPSGSATETPPDLLVMATEDRAERPPAQRGVVIIAVGVPAASDADIEADVPDALGTVLAAEDRARPTPLGDDTRRLIAVYGATAIAPMLASFADLLDEALAALSCSDAAATAHRVAGVAGTLGFGALGRRWLALSEGQAIDMGALRVASRRAIATLSREVPRLAD
jgi:hypothetical protein